MITYEMIKEAQTTLIDDWGETGKQIIAYVATLPPLNCTFDEFLKTCTACGGNWGGMFLSGIKRVYPIVWDMIPNDMGVCALFDICSLLVLLGVDTSE